VDHSWAEILGALVQRQDLTTDQTAWAMGEVLAGAATPAQIAGLAVSLRAKGETIDEVTGLLDAMYAEEGSALDGSCDLTIDLSVPAGLSFGNASLCYGYGIETSLEVPWTPAPAELSLSYGYVGGEMRTVDVSEVSSFEFPCIELTDVWTSCESSPPQLALHFSGHAPAGTYLVWQGFALGSPQETSDWRTCSGEPIDRGQSGLYDDCSAATGSPCREGLVCEQHSDALGAVAEFCRVPGQPLLPEGQLCEHSAQCADNLSCGGPQGASIDTSTCHGSN
jgi:hypothetical protein